MVIDCHTHLGRDPQTIDAKAEALLRSMDAARIDAALVYAGTINGCTNEWLLREIGGRRDRLRAVASVSPLMGGAETVREIRDLLAGGDVVGLKFYPGYEHYYPGDAVVRPYLELLRERGLPAIFHSGDTFCKVGAAKLKYAHPLHVDDLATEMPNLAIVIAHLGYPWVTDAAEVCYKNKNVYADCSGFVYGAFTAKQQRHFRRVVREFSDVAGGAEKVLFGTDWPIGDQRSYLKVAQRLFRKDVRAVFSGNATKLFRLPL